jgi:hypothetical protein
MFAAPLLTGRIVRTLALVAIGISFVPHAVIAAEIDYDIVYVRQPRYGDETQTNWPEVFHPAILEPGADLMLLHPNVPIVPDIQVPVPSE